MVVPLQYRTDERSGTERPTALMVLRTKCFVSAGVDFRPKGGPHTGSCRTVHRAGKEMRQAGGKSLCTKSLNSVRLSGLRCFRSRRSRM